MARDSVRQGGILGLWGACCPASTACRAHGVAPTLAIVRVGERPDDLSYERTCARQADLRHRRASFRAANGRRRPSWGRHRPRECRCAHAMFRPLPPQMDGSASLPGQRYRVFAVLAGVSRRFPPATQACLETLDLRHSRCGQVVVLRVAAS